MYLKIHIHTKKIGRFSSSKQLPTACLLEGFKTRWISSRNSGGGALCHGLVLWRWAWNSSTSTAFRGGPPMLGIMFGQQKSVMKKRRLLKIWWRNCWYHAVGKQHLYCNFFFLWGVDCKKLSRVTNTIFVIWNAILYAINCDVLSLTAFFL